MKMLLLLSGPMAVGKSAVARELIENHQFGSVRTGRYLSELARAKGGGNSRADLQRLGDTLDNETDYEWVIDVSNKAMASAPTVDRWLFDSVRKQRQVDHFRTRYERNVVHAHLTAPDEVLRQRYEERLLSGGEYAGNITYAAAVLHPNEIAARGLIDIASYVLDLSQTSPRDAAAAILRDFKKGVG